MKYSEQIEINLPIQKVIELFDNPDNLKKWQPELLSLESLTGIPGEEGSTTKLKYKVGRRKIWMTETITDKKLPNERTEIYETRGVYNVVKNRFIPAAGDKTVLVSEQEFEFKGIKKLVAIMKPDNFIKETRQRLLNFKEFAENPNQE
jgi:uncharacterized membrane protein